MYETFIKQFIDIMDEQAPVTIVRNRMEMPLGSVCAEQSTWIHARLDLLDDASPYVDVVMTPQNEQVQVGYIVHLPSNDEMTDEQLVRNTQQMDHIDSISVVQPIKGSKTDWYVIKGHMDVQLADEQNNMNSLTHELSNQIVSVMRSTGYDHLNADPDPEEDEIVTWNTEKTV
ncbi:hypothetical protein DNHGIG_28890 [Collibacillus ludicampi]|uniref:Uncharacterized protein n=1 Tax=Collibacillus ludicampi TaxID=2771369 RepID=A0AAV4LHS7_9BACL|nr:hypothetical protein [Collibacillus ludicampi]GIM47340.1 hypothetical protein DNHGIG_28890 [Collibacillus ludicampi]